MTQLKGSFRPQAGSIPTCAVAIIAASVLAGCTVRAEAPAEPERFKRHVLAVESSMGQARSGIAEDRLTGCLYSFTYADGVKPITLPDGAHAGCQSATGEG
jgi:hypothetical protein